MKTSNQMPEVVIARTLRVPEVTTTAPESNHPLLIHYTVRSTVVGDNTDDSPFRRRRRRFKLVPTNSTPAHATTRDREEHASGLPRDRGAPMPQHLWACLVPTLSTHATNAGVESLSADAATSTTTPWLRLLSTPYFVFASPVGDYCFVGYWLVRPCTSPCRRCP